MFPQAQFGLILDPSDIINPFAYFIVSMFCDFFVEPAILIPVQSVLRTYDPFRSIDHLRLTLLSILDSPFNLFFDFPPFIKHLFFFGALFDLLLSLPLIQLLVLLLLILCL